MDRFNKNVLLLTFLLIASHVGWWLVYASKASDLARAETELAAITQDKKILSFQKMFVDKVLLAHGVVDFNTRVELQNAVTAIGDTDITQAWNAFLSASTEAEGQARVKALLSLLAGKAYE